jgi:hypothetical protein
VKRGLPVYNVSLGTTPSIRNASLAKNVLVNSVLNVILVAVISVRVELILKQV